MKYSQSLPIILTALIASNACDGQISEESDNTCYTKSETDPNNAKHTDEIRKITNYEIKVPSAWGKEEFLAESEIYCDSIRENQKKLLDAVFQISFERRNNCSEDKEIFSEFLNPDAYETTGNLIQQGEHDTTGIECIKVHTDNPNENLTSCIYIDEATKTRILIEANNDKDKAFRSHLEVSSVDDISDTLSANSIGLVQSEGGTPVGIGAIEGASSLSATYIECSDLEDKQFIDDLNSDIESVHSFYDALKNQ